jgi:hypothetical protein
MFKQPVGNLGIHGQSKGNESIGIAKGKLIGKAPS